MCLRMQRHDSIEKRLMEAYRLKQRGSPPKKLLFSDDEYPPLTKTDIILIGTFAAALFILTIYLWMQGVII